jgi:hypothetical protein
MILRVLCSILPEYPQFEHLLPHVKGNIDFVFTAGDPRRSARSLPPTRLPPQCAVEKMNTKIVATVKPRFYAIPRERRTYKYKPNMTTYAPEITHFSLVYHNKLSLP